jgi:hypothetical protein
MFISSVKALEEVTRETLPSSTTSPSEYVLILILKVSTVDGRLVGTVMVIVVDGSAVNDVKSVMEIVLFVCMVVYVDLGFILFPSV